MKTRILKIEPIYNERTERHMAPPSYLRLKGYWLARAGFLPGDRVEITTNAGRLVIRKRRSSAS